VGKFRTHDEAPRVLIANSNLVGQWNNYAEFNRLERLGLTMYGQMTAGSWIYIGSQGIVQGTFETFAAAGRKHFGGSLEGKFVLTGGLGGMGGAQPLAATMNGAVFLGVEVDPVRIEKRLKSGYCDKIARSLDDALKLIETARKDRQSISVGLVGNCADVLPEIVKRGVVPDVLTDQTSAHDALNGYVPHGIQLADALALRRKNPDEYIERAMQSMAVHVEAMLALQKKGAVTFDYGHSGFRSGIHSPPFLRRARPVSLGGIERRAGRHRPHRQTRARIISQKRNARALDETREGTNPISRIARANLLARLRRARRVRSRHERFGQARQD